MAKQKRQITKEEYENAIKVRRKISSTINQFNGGRGGY